MEVRVISSDVAESFVDGSLGLPLLGIPSDIPPGLETQEYTLNAGINAGCLRFYLSPTTTTKFKAGDAPLRMRAIPKPQSSSNPLGCVIKLNLGSGVGWRFANKGTDKVDPITLGKCGDGKSIQDRYRCLIPLDDKTLTFYAIFNSVASGGTYTNRDTINIIVAINQVDVNGDPLSEPPLVLIIDPDIKNPGDDY